MRDHFSANFCPVDSMLVLECIIELWTCFLFVHSAKQLGYKALLA